MGLLEDDEGDKILVDELRAPESLEPTLRPSTNAMYQALDDVDVRSSRCSR
jgi:hypothetical protein